MLRRQPCGLFAPRGAGCHDSGGRRTGGGDRPEKGAVGPSCMSPEGLARWFAAVQQERNAGALARDAVVVAQARWLAGGVE